MKKQLAASLCLLLFYAPSAWPDGKQSHAEIRKTAMEFVQLKMQSMPGKVAIKVEDLDPRSVFPACSPLEAFLPTGAQMFGRTSIGVRCNEKNGWSVFIPATITITVNMLVSSKPLQQGQALGAGDFNIQAGELNQMGLITDESLALGKIMKFSIGAGQPLKQDMLRLPYAVTQGQTVQLVYEGRGINLRTEGQAMNNAAEGQAVQVKVPSGQVIGGIARGSGAVEVRR